MKISLLFFGVYCFTYAGASPILWGYNETFKNNSVYFPIYEHKSELEKIYDDTSVELREKNPDVDLNVYELIQKYGYPVERHRDIKTEDGYLLEMHRIPHGRNNANLTDRPIAFVMHGILCSSADWVLMGPEKGLAYILADNGYDVWLGNARGNTWSRKHVKYDPDKNEKEFWNFSWHEIGTRDLPAMMDHITKITDQDNMYFIAHSQGTTAFFVMASERPQYAKRIKLMSALSPIVYMKNCPNPFFRLAAKVSGIISVIAKLFGLHEFLPGNSLLNELGQTLCKDEAITQSICSNIIFLIAGYNSPQLNKTMIPVIVSKTPAGSSTKQLLHYAQEINTNYFRQYDYGWFKNFRTYGSFSPPNYKLKIETHIALFYGDNDWLAAEQDVNKLYKTLPNVVYYYKVKGFNHLDFLWAIDADKLLYKRVLSLMKRF